MILLLVAVSIAAFILVSVSPIDPLQANVGQVALGAMSAEQIAALECPSNYWMVLGLAVKSSYDNPLITKENIDDLGNEAQDVSVLFKTDSDDREDIRRAVEEVIANYGITEDMIIHKTTLRPFFIAKLDTEMIARMLEDPMIVSVLVERASGNEIYIYN